MRTIVIAAAAALPLLTGSAFAQEGGSAFTNAPNEQPWFFQPDATIGQEQADAAGPFGHSEARPEIPDKGMIAGVPPNSDAN